MWVVVEGELIQIFGLLYRESAVETHRVSHL